MTVQHIVMLEFNDGVAEDAKAAALKEVEALKGKIDGIESIVSGKDFSGRAGNFTHAVIVGFSGDLPADRVRYPCAILQQCTVRVAKICVPAEIAAR